MGSPYTAAFCPPAPEVLRRRLLPLSLGHCVLLEAVGSPFVRAGGARVKPGDLALAVFICSHPSKATREAHYTPDKFALDIQWGLDCKGLDFVAEKKAFEEYLESSLKMPEIWQESGSKAPVAAWQFSVVAALMKGGLGREEAWDMPVAEALALYAAMLEREGAELVSPEEAAIMARMRGDEP